MNNKIYTLLTVVLLLATIFIIYKKCDSIKKDKELSEVILTKHDSVQKEWKYKTLQFPNSLYNLKTQKSLKEQLNKNNKEYTIISYLDADCSDCVGELNKWKEFLSSDSKILQKLDIIFIATSSNKEMFKYQVYDLAKFKYNIFFDEKNEFISLNNISPVKTYQTILLKDNKIVYLGSPVKDKLFEKEIKEKLEI
jgi:hypothetical protein